MKLSVCSVDDETFANEVMSCEPPKGFEVDKSGKNVNYTLLEKIEKNAGTMFVGSLVKRNRTIAFDNVTRTSSQFHTNPYCQATSVLKDCNIINPYTTGKRVIRVLAHIDNTHALPLINNVSNANIELTGSVRSTLIGCLSVKSITRPDFGIADSIQGLDLMRIRRPARLLAVVTPDDARAIVWPSGEFWKVWRVGKDASRIVVYCGSPDWKDEGGVEECSYITHKSSDLIADKCRCGTVCATETRDISKKKNIICYDGDMAIDTPTIGECPPNKLINHYLRYNEICESNRVDLTELSPLDHFANQISLGSYTKRSRVESDVIVTSSVTSRVAIRTIMAHAENVGAVQTSREKTEIHKSLLARFDREPTSYSQDVYSELVETARFFRQGRDHDLVGPSTREAIASRINRRGAVGEFEGFNNLGDVVDRDDLWDLACPKTPKSAPDLH